MDIPTYHAGDTPYYHPPSTSTVSASLLHSALDVSLPPSLPHHSAVVTAAVSPPPLSPSSGGKKDGKTMQKRGAKACLQCRKGKNRCEGADDPPCKRCRQHNHECKFDEKPPRAAVTVGESLNDKVAALEREVVGMQNELGGVQDKLDTLINILQPGTIPAPSSNGITIDPALQQELNGLKRAHQSDEDPTLGEMAREALKRRRVTSEAQSKEIVSTFLDSMAFGVRGESFDNLQQRSPLAADCLLAAAAASANPLDVSPAVLSGLLRDAQESIRSALAS